MKNWLEKQFKLSEFHTDVKTELLAGLTTFVTMAYVLATVPNILGGADLDKHVVLTAMVLLIILTSCALVFRSQRSGCTGDPGEYEARGQRRHRSVHRSSGREELRAHHCECRQE